jgi:HAD superfamily hydrolase (TIGR01490 family)
MAQRARLALFDLDHTLLDGDSDQLWCEFLIARGVLPREPFATDNEAMARDYALGLVSAQEFCEFYLGTLAGRSAAMWQALRDEYFARQLEPRLSAAAADLVARHRDAGERIVLTTATCRFLAEPSAGHLGIADLIATEAETDAAGCFTGRVLGTPNMREGKVERLHAWLAAQGLRHDACTTTMYSDSINDLPLLLAADEARVVHPDPRLAAEARRRGWPVVLLR